MTRPRPLIHTPHNLYATFSEENYDEDDDDDDDCFFLLLKSAATTTLTPATCCIASHTYGKWWKGAAILRKIHNIRIEV